MEQRKEKNGRTDGRKDKRLNKKMGRNKTNGLTGQDTNGYANWEEQATRRIKRTDRRTEHVRLWMMKQTDSIARN